MVVPPRAVSADARLTATTAGPAPPASAGTFSPALAAAAPPVSFDLAGARITGTVSLTFAVTPTTVQTQISPTNSSVAVWLSSYDPGSAGWQPMASSYDRKTRSVTAQITHLSWWAPFTWNWKAIELRLRTSLSAFGSGRAAAAACPPLDGVTVSNGGGQDPPIIGCASHDASGNLAVSIANNRAYAMVVQAPAEAVLSSPRLKGFEEFVQSHDHVVAALGGPYLAPTAALTYTLPMQGDPVVFSAAPSLKTHVLDLAVVTATAIFDAVTGGYANCILDAVSRSDPAPLSVAPGMIVGCFPGLAAAGTLIKFYVQHIEPLSKAIQALLGTLDKGRDALLGTHGEVHVTGPVLPPPSLYVSTGYTRGSLYQLPNFPTQIGLNNHDSITGLRWSAVGPQSATATGVLNEDNCVPNCAQGGPITTQVQLVASNPKKCTVTIYQDYSDTATMVRAYVYSTIALRAPSGSSPILSGPPLFAPACP